MFQWANQNISGIIFFYIVDQEVLNNAKTYQLQQRYSNCTIISGTRSYYCFISLPKSRLVIIRLSSVMQELKLKLYDDTIKSVLSHLQLIENNLHLGKYVACICNQDWYIGVITECSDENKVVYIQFMK